MAQDKEFSEVYPVPMSGLNMPAPLLIQMSFEAGEQTTTRVFVAGKIRINRMRIIVIRALAITDAGTITLQDESGNLITTLSLPASAPLNTEVDSGIISNINQDIELDTHFRLVSAKATAGGRVLVSVEYSILPSR